jgi:hypothetical protein
LQRSSVSSEMKRFLRHTARTSHMRQHGLSITDKRKVVTAGYASLQRVGKFDEALYSAQVGRLVVIVPICIGQPGECVTCMRSNDGTHRWRTWARSLSAGGCEVAKAKVLRLRAEPGIRRGAVAFLAAKCTHFTDPPAPK